MGEIMQLVSQELCEHKLIYVHEVSGSFLPITITERRVKRGKQPLKQN